MAESWMAWTVVTVLVVLFAAKFIQRAADEWSSRNYDEYHFNGYEDPYWRN